MPADNYLHSGMEKGLEWYYRKSKKRFDQWFTFFPLQGYLIAFALCSFGGHLFLNHQFLSEPSLFNDLLAALIKLVRLVFFPLLLAGLATVLIPFVWLWIEYKQRKLKISLESPSDVSEGHQQELRFNIHPLWQPLFGQVYYQLIYGSGKERSPKFSLVRKENILGYAGQIQNGWYKWPVPGVKEYEVDAMIIYMEDFFHFFRFAIKVKVNQSFFTQPANLQHPPLDISPGKTENEDIRIRDWRKVQGEWINFKSFDDSDDVRRIVWKIYARNKELVVRTPEILNPYASHVSLFVSFFDALEARFSDAVNNVCLDFYKSACFTLHNILIKQGLKVRLYTDAKGMEENQHQKPEEVAYAFAKCQWQNEVSIEEFIEIKNNPVICISSLSKAEHVENMLESIPPDASVFFVPLSHAAPFPRGWNWIKWLWVETEKEPSYRVSLLWYISPVRRKVLENEKRIRSILRRSGKKFIEFNLLEGIEN